MSNAFKRSKNTSFLKRVGKYFFVIGLALMLSMTASAQTDPGDAGNDPDTIYPDTTVPFDGGAYLLVAAGVAYGIVLWRKAYKKNKEVISANA